MADISPLSAGRHAVQLPECDKFISGGTTQNDYTFQVCKRLRKEIEIRGFLQFEGWKAPIYKTGAQSDTSASVQITWFSRESK
jgi:hypothetical protein